VEVGESLGRSGKGEVDSGRIVLGGCKCSPDVTGGEVQMSPERIEPRGQGWKVNGT